MPSKGELAGFGEAMRDYAAAIAVYVDESARLQQANLGTWRVSGEIAGRTISRTCHNWAGARLAMSILEKRGAEFIRYQRQS